MLLDDREQAKEIQRESKRESVRKRERERKRANSMGAAITFSSSVTCIYGIYHGPPTNDRLTFVSHHRCLSAYVAVCLCVIYFRTIPIDPNETPKAVNGRGGNEFQSEIRKP